MSDQGRTITRDMVRENIKDLRDMYKTQCALGMTKIAKTTLQAIWEWQDILDEDIEDEL